MATTVTRNFQSAASIPRFASDRGRTVLALLGSILLCASGCTNGGGSHGSGGSLLATFSDLMSAMRRSGRVEWTLEKRDAA